MEEKQNLPGVSTAEGIFHQVDMCSLPFVEMGTRSQRGGHHRKPHANLVLLYLTTEVRWSVWLALTYGKIGAQKGQASYSTLGVKSELKARSLFSWHNRQSLEEMRG